MTHPDCFHWEDTNENTPPDGVEVIGMWIDSNGTTSAMPVTYHDWSPTNGVAYWEYDDQHVRDPHAWCATPPQPGATADVKPQVKPPKWVTTVASILWSIALVIVGGAFVGMPVGIASTQAPPWDVVLFGGQMVALTVTSWLVRRRLR